MREIEEYTAEVRRRVAVESRARRQRRTRMLAVCLPLVLCVAVGALVLPPLLARPQTDAVSGNAPEQRTPVAGAADDDGLAAGLLDGEAAPENALEQAVSDPGDPAAESWPDDEMEGLAESGSDSTAPEDFSFRFVWGCYGISSYDSRTGELVKTSDSTHPEDYVTTLELNEVQLAEAWALLSGLKLERYPAVYDPYNAPGAETRVASEPNRTLILTLWANGRETTVTCRDICLGGLAQGYDARAQAFLRSCDRLTDLLTQTPEWAALPDYEFYYE